MNENIISPFLKVVTVDDSPLVAERMGAILNDIKGIEFLENAKTIISARNLINTVKPDVVILDINLEEGEFRQTGIDLLVELRQNYPQMKIIIFTNHNELHYRLVCLAKGANYFFDKSSESHKISDVIKQWIIKK
ncbi:MAG: response regulator transcription factor [Bacteroidetes bacterium]|nr:response regulator transcription factor [Bacteroidota bacterium]